MSQADYIAKMNRYYEAKWKSHDGFWSSQYKGAGLVKGITLYQRRNEAIVSAIHEHQAAILDIGCGKGDLLYLLANKADKLVGIDPAFVNVDKTRSNLRSCGITNANVILGVAEHVPLPDAQFDVVIMADVIEHIPDTEAVLHEVRRLLRPGGIFICVTPRRNLLFTFTFIDELLRRFYRRLMNKPIENAESHPFERFLSKQELEDTLQRAGFKIECYRAICFFPGPEGRSILLSLLDRLYQRLSPEQGQRLFALLIRLFNQVEKLQFLNQKQLWIARI
ncbi:MAG TPA: class I SAM-dependent methyltransferase [Caldilineaceae bacterium]|nr:class I SAM-dependent methyltransferase [Caldilineaceae bacterium]